MSDSGYVPSDRRPIESRNTRWAEAITQILASRSITPNSISLFGMVAAIAAGIAFGWTSQVAGVAQRAFWLLGGILCQVRLLCNLFDGMVAVKRGIASRKGELYNEVPDRVSDVAVFVGLGYAAGGNATLGFSTAIVCVFVAYIRAAAKSIGAPNDFCGPMAKPQRMAVVTLLAGYMTFSPIGWRLSWGEASLALGIVAIGGIVTAGRRLLRTARHLEGLPQ